MARFKNNFFILVLMIPVVWFNSCDTRNKKVNPPQSVAEIDLSKNLFPDADFLALLSSSGVLAAAKQIGLDIDAYLKPLTQRIDHAYRRYRWSVDYHPDGGIMINALPPEDELGWTLWERWYKDKNGITRKEAWVMYPLISPSVKGIARWYKLEEDTLLPHYLIEAPTLEDIFRRARIYEAANVLEFDANKVLIKPLSEKARLYYQKCRWLVIPHLLALDGPVIYILPPMDKSDDCPWESWYSDGNTKLIHHVHFTKKNDKTTGIWKEYPGAPQRPPEIFGVTWYWYEDKDLKPFVLD